MSANKASDDSRLDSRLDLVFLLTATVASGFLKDKWRSILVVE